MPWPLDVGSAQALIASWNEVLKARAEDKGSTVERSTGKSFFRRASRFARFLVYALASHTRLDRFKSILDVGCGFGLTLDTIRSAISPYQETSLFGIEPSEAARKIAETKVGVQMIGLRVEDLAIVAAQFDLIILSHVLEHMYDPVETLRLLSSRVSPDGYVLLEVPNFHGHPSVDMGHNFLFTPKSLTNTARAAGLNIVALYATDHVRDDRPFYLTALLRPSASDYRATAEIDRESVAEVTAGRRRALHQWDFTRPRIGTGDKLRLALAALLKP